jgi:superfamily I DNA/RNA helicase
MSKPTFVPTPQQEKIVNHPGSVFVEACPGAGKTRVMVERARKLLGDRKMTRGMAFLSFTNAAVGELAARLRREGLMTSTPYPHFVDTFDSFLWKFLLAPFGAPGCARAPRLMPDKGKLEIRPFPTSQPLPLVSFDRITGNIIADEAKLAGFDVATRAASVSGYETVARSTRKRLLEQGFLDHDDVRSIALERIQDPELAPRLAAALAARFQEVIVDEAQDCNPADLHVVRWLKKAGIPTKVICDPHQSIYRFRGGVADHLFAFKGEFDGGEQLPLTGNFRSTGSICKAIVAFRDKDHRAQADEPLGKHKDDATPVHVIVYVGAVTQAIGDKFLELLIASGMEPSTSPVIAATRSSGGSAVGLPAAQKGEDLTLRLASAVMDFHFAGEASGRIRAMEELHRIILKMEGRLEGVTYKKRLLDDDIKPDDWRPQIVAVLSHLRYDPATYPTVDLWLESARQLLACHVSGGKTIKQLLRNNADLTTALAPPSILGLASRTIHSVKGMEFPAACVVMTTQKAKGIIDHLESGEGNENIREESRKIYVAASRAERLLVIAAPQSQAARLAQHLRTQGANVLSSNV